MDIRNLIINFQPQCAQESEEKRMILHYIDAYSDLLYRSNETAHFTASSWIVNPEHTKVLMIYHNIYNSWSWVGGHADGESDLLSVALREAREETALEDVRAVSSQPLSVEILPVAAHFRRGQFVVPHLHLNVTYLLEAEEKQRLRIKPDENSGVRWFSLEDAVSASCEPYMRVIYRKLNARI